MWGRLSGVTKAQRGTEILPKITWEISEKPRTESNLPVPQSRSSWGGWEALGSPWSRGWW